MKNQLTITIATPSTKQGKTTCLAIAHNVQVNSKETIITLDNLSNMQLSSKITCTRKYLANNGLKITRCTLNGLDITNTASDIAIRKLLGESHGTAQKNKASNSKGLRKSASNLIKFQKCVGISRKLGYNTDAYSGNKYIDFWNMYKIGTPIQPNGVCIHNETINKVFG